ncbi:CAP domain-containing protein [Ilumatobacter sp.]|uniref:CAP domain-containing protein n=1 Tax=Ilumatobacter sp. TaxID=1967498 RepID=UPI003B52C974
MKKLLPLVLTVAVLAPAGGVAGAPSLDLAESAGAHRSARRVGDPSATEGTTPPPPSSDEGGSGATLAEVLALTNDHRRAHGLTPLRIDVSLAAAADRHSRDQAACERMSHTGSDGSSAGDRIARAGYRWRRWAENVAYGYRTPEAVVGGWMSSPGHRANILSRHTTEVGVGVAESASGRAYWTQVFATPA